MNELIQLQELHIRLKTCKICEKIYFIPDLFQPSQNGNFDTLLLTR